jgi:hypothetical protein
VKFNEHLRDYETRRINLTFRYVPEEYIYPLEKFPKEKIEDIRPYLNELSNHSSFWKENLKKFSPV